MKTNLRRFQKSDLQKVVEIEQRIYGHPWSLAHFQAELSSQQSRGYILENPILEVLVGYFFCWILFDECYLLNIGVDIPFQGRGFAHCMMKEFMSLLRRESIQKAYLEVRVSHSIAIHLYESFDFSIFFRKNRFYSDGEDAYYMQWNLNESTV